MYLRPIHRLWAFVHEFEPYRVAPPKDTYCVGLNLIVRELCLTEGERVKNSPFLGTTYVCQNKVLKLVYQESNFGYELYHIYTNPEFCEETPFKIGSSMMEDGWYYVYKCVESPDGEKVVQRHMPGTWSNFFFHPSRYAD